MFQIIKFKNFDKNILDFLSKDIGSLCLAEEFADVHLVIDGERIPGHKMILAARSEYFRALLCGNMSESSKNEIVLPILVPADYFKILLQFIYKGKVDFEPEKAFEILHLANQFCIEPVETAISSYLQNNLSTENIVDAFNAGCLYSLEPLIKKCHDFVSMNMKIMIAQNLLQDLSESALELVLQRSHFIPDKHFRVSIQKWINQNGSKCPHFIERFLETNSLSMENEGIFLNLGQEKEINFIKLVLPNRTDDILDKQGYPYIIEASNDKQNWARLLNYDKYPCNSVQNLYFKNLRIQYLNIFAVKCDLDIKKLEVDFKEPIPRMLNDKVYPTFNVATEEMGAWGSHSELLNGNMTNYGGMHGFAAHDIPNREYLLVRLSQPFVIDSLRLLLWDHNSRYYHYYVEFSLDNIKWTRVVDRTRKPARSWQNFCFNPIAVMFIKIAGTHNTENRWFHCVHFECPSQNLTDIVRI